MVLHIHSECGVTANILVLGTSDSGFESLHSDNKMKDNLISYYDLQLRFCKKVSEIKKIALEKALLEFSSIYKDIGIKDWNFNKENPDWISFIKEFSKNDPLLTIVEFCSDKIMKSSTNISFGNFSFEYNEKDETIKIHFQNLNHNKGLLSNHNRRLSEIKDMFIYIKNNYPDAKIVKGFSWLYNLKSYNSLFPEEYINNITINKNWFKSLALWEQFFDGEFNLRKDILLFFNENLDKIQEQDVNKCFYFRVLEPECEIKAFYSFYNI